MIPWILVKILSGCIIGVGFVYYLVKREDKKIKKKRGY